MAAELPRPGVEVIQKFRTVSPTVVTPQLIPTVVGICRQIVDVLTTTDTGGSDLNTSALVQLPAIDYALPASGSPLAYSGLAGKNLVLSINGGPNVTVRFAWASNSPASVVAQIVDSFALQGVTEATAVLFGEDRFALRTVGVGEFQSIEYKSTTDPEVTSAFGFLAGYKVSGKSSYNQYQSVLPTLVFPDPRGNLDQIVVEPSTVRVFFGTSATDLRELSRTEALLRRGGGGTAASVLGTVSLATGGLYGSGGTLDGKTLTVALDGGSAVSVAMGTGVGAPTNVNDLLHRINLALGGQVATDGTSGLRLTSLTTGPTSRVVVTGTAATAALGITGSAASATGASGVQVVDDGNGDGVSPLVHCVGQDFSAAATAAVATGLTAITTLTYPGDLANRTLVMSVAGRDPQTLTFDPAVANSAAVLSAINAFWSGLVVATVNGSNQLVLTSVATGEDGMIDIVGGTALEKLGLTPSVTGAVATTTIQPNPATLNGRKLRVDFNGTVLEHTFSGLLSGSTANDIATALATTFTSVGLVSVQATNLIRIALKGGGQSAYVQVLAATSNEAATYLGFNVGQRGAFTSFTGGPLPPQSGDVLVVDGAVLGRILEKSPGGVVTRLRLDKNLAISATTGNYFYVVAKNLSAGLVGRPAPELTVSGIGTAALKPRLLRDTIGTPLASKSPAYVAYRALRQDVTAAADNPALLVFDSVTQVEEVIGPINPLNPLALGAYFALQNAPGTQVTALGVDANSADAPFGTVEAFTRAAEFLEAHEVYAIAPLTHDGTVAQVYAAHASAMSEPSAKGERICLFNLPMPTRQLDKLVAAGNTGNAVGGAGLQFDTGVAQLPSLLLAAGVSPVGTIPASAGLFLDIASDNKHYSVSSVSGSVVTLRTAFSAGDNDDNFYSTTATPAVLIDEDYALRVRGLPLTVASTGALDKNAAAATVSDRARTFSNRRFWSVFPDQCAATLNGLEQVVDGFYLCAAVAGMIAQQPPQQSFTNFPMVGFTRVIGSNGFFTEKQLNVIAAGGNYIVVQDAQGAPLISRHALTTDMTSRETYIDSITKCVDFTAKFLRQGIKGLIGRFNITQGFIDTISQIAHGLLHFLIDLGVLTRADINNIIQDEDAPDTLLIDVTIEVPFPCNTIRLTLNI